MGLQVKNQIRVFEAAGSLLDGLLYSFGTLHHEEVAPISATV